MPQDAFTIRHVAKELKRILTGGKISRIIQPSRDCIVFIVYTREGNIKLEACLSAQGARLNLTRGETEAPPVAPSFCMLLRKHLQNAEIADVAQPDFERIIYFDLKCVSEFSVEHMRLYFEIMGKYSNAVLCRNGIIAGALKPSSLGDGAKRVLLGGVKYELPPPQDKLSPSDIEGIDELLKERGGDKAKLISENVKGISYSTALEIVADCHGNATGKRIFDYVYSDSVSPCVTYTDGEPADFKARSSQTDKELYPDILSAQSAYYALVTVKRSFAEKKARLAGAVDSLIKKCEKRLAQVREKLSECRDAENVKLKGELITANIFAVKRGDTRLEAINYYDENCAKITVELDGSLTPSQNAQKYYKKYAKLKRTKLCAEELLAESQTQKDYLDSINAHVCAAETPCDLEETEQELAALLPLKSAEKKKKKAAPPPYRTYEFEGFKIVAGRNNMQNERLTKSLSQSDLWLHAQKYHSSHVAVIADGKAVPDGAIKVAAEICAYYSEGRDGSKIPIDYTLKKFVKKPPSSNTGFVVYTDYRTTLVNPDKHAELATDGTDGEGAAGGVRPKK